MPTMGKPGGSEGMAAGASGFVRGCAATGLGLAPFFVVRPFAPAIFPVGLRVAAMELAPRSARGFGTGKLRAEDIWMAHEGQSLCFPPQHYQDKSGALKRVNAA